MKNPAASIKQRLLNKAKAEREDFNLTLTRYGMERLLYRIGASPHASSFILKGAALFFLWDPSLRHRPTRDIDLLSFGSPDLERVHSIFVELCAVAAPEDGLSFDPSTVLASRIKEGLAYEGVRITLRAALGGAVIPLSVDVGFGDAVTPGAITARYPTLLDDSPAPEVRAYPRATVIAEKSQAMMDLGMINTRLKDFFDVAFLSRSFEFSGEELVLAFQRTFERRQTDLPADLPVAWTEAFFKSPDKEKEWKAFLRKNKLEEESLEAVVCQLRGFLWPVVEAARSGALWARSWPPGGPWGDGEG